MIEQSEESTNPDFINTEAVIKNLSVISNQLDSFDLCECMEKREFVHNAKKYFAEYAFIVFYNEVEKRMVTEVKKELKKMNKDYVKHAGAVLVKLYEKFGTEVGKKRRNQEVEGNRLQDINVAVLKLFKDFKDARRKVSHFEVEAKEVTWDEVNGNNEAKENIIQIAQKVTDVMVNEYLIFADVYLKSVLEDEKNKCECQA